MNRFIVRWAINAASLYTAIRIVPGIHAQDTHWAAIFGLALIFGLLNALLRPVLKFMTCPMIVLTLGLFTLLINAFMFYMAGAIGTRFGFGFHVDGFWYALLGSIVTSLVSVALSLLLKDELEK
ncbi:MAG: phage holin family protein [Chloroflexota bacterium]|nr:phage holin family protein [Chloroflexota bacterium]